MKEEYNLEELDKDLKHLIEIGLVKSMIDEEGKEVFSLTDEGMLFCKYNFKKEILN